jgi:secondary thiamine-phosphate synthase enzyme
MRFINNTVSLDTQQKQQLINLTSSINEAVDGSGVQSGFVGVYSQHTTASVFVSECQPALSEDVAEFFNQIVKEGLPYKHNSPEFSDCDRKNATSHLRSLLAGQSVLIPVVDGKLVLGQFQSIMFAEFDGPRRRSLHVQVLGQ